MRIRNCNISFATIWRVRHAPSPPIATLTFPLSGVITSLFEFISKLERDETVGCADSRGNNLIVDPATNGGVLAGHDEKTPFSPHKLQGSERHCSTMLIVPHLGSDGICHFYPKLYRVPTATHTSAYNGRGVLHMRGVAPTISRHHRFSTLPCRKGEGRQEAELVLERRLWRAISKCNFSCLNLIYPLRQAEELESQREIEKRAAAQEAFDSFDTNDDGKDGVGTG